MPVQYKPNDENKDFYMMINNEKYSDTLFIFNDNVEQAQSFISYVKLIQNNEFNSKNKEHKKLLDNSGSGGGGNAIIRPYQILDRPRSIGIPTGSITLGKGFKSLDEKVVVDGKKLGSAKDMIDESLELLKFLVDKYGYKKVAYSADKNGNLGSGIFKFTDEINKYIVNGIYEILGQHRPNK